MAELFVQTVEEIKDEKKYLVTFWEQLVWKYLPGRFLYAQARRSK